MEITTKDGKKKVVVKEVAKTSGNTKKEGNSSSGQRA